jgi:hypothetical protein
MGRGWCAEAWIKPEYSWISPSNASNRGFQDN